MAAQSLLDMLLAQVIKRQRVVVLVATNLDVVTAQKNHPQEGQNQRKLFKNFERKLVDALSKPNPSGEPPELNAGDEVFVFDWNGKSVPKLPKNLTKVVVVSHGQAMPGALLPQGGSGNAPEVSPKEFVDQLNKGLGNSALPQLMIMGCDTEEDVANAVSSMMPDTHVRGSDGTFTLGNTYSFSGSSDPRAGDLSIRPSDGVYVDYKVYDTKSARGGP